MSYKNSKERTRLMIIKKTWVDHRVFFLKYAIRTSLRWCKEIPTKIDWQRRLIKKNIYC